MSHDRLCEAPPTTRDRLAESEELASPSNALCSVVPPALQAELEELRLKRDELRTELENARSEVARLKARRGSR